MLDVFKRHQPAQNLLVSQGESTMGPLERLFGGELTGESQTMAVLTRGGGLTQVLHLNLRGDCDRAEDRGTASRSMLNMAEGLLNMLCSKPSA